LLSGPKSVKNSDTTPSRTCQRTPAALVWRSSEKGEAGTLQARKVFLSYRREDSAGEAGRLADRLTHDLGKDTIFMDVDGIPLGVDFVKRLTAEVASCDVLLAVIGPRWLEVRDNKGNRRLDNPNDFVRVEISTALERDIPLIPILLSGTQIPSADDLPLNLAGLSVRNGLEVRHSSFHSDLDRLVRQLRRQLLVGSNAGTPDDKPLQVSRSSSQVELPQSIDKQVADSWKAGSSAARWLELARQIPRKETASASSVSTSDLPRPSAIGMPPSYDSKIRQILLWAAGTFVGFSIFVLSVTAIPFFYYGRGDIAGWMNDPVILYRTTMYALGLGLQNLSAFVSILLTIGVLGLTASGLFVRRMPMLIAAGFTAWAACYVVIGLFLLFLIRTGAFWMLVTAVVIQLLFLWLTKFR
jgi:hypothetical protein